MLEKFTPKQAEKKHNLLLKEKSVNFYKELKNKRVSKIKSRIYHKIKKK